MVHKYTEIEKIEIDNLLSNLSHEQKVEFNFYYEGQKKNYGVGLLMIMLLSFIAGGNIYFGKYMPKWVIILVVVGWLTTYLYIGILLLSAVSFIYLYLLDDAITSHNYDLKNLFLAQKDPSYVLPIELMNDPFGAISYDYNNYNKYDENQNYYPNNNQQTDNNQAHFSDNHQVNNEVQESSSNDMNTNLDNSSSSADDNNNVENNEQDINEED